MPVGIVVFAFALREESEEPNPCNVRLARVAAHFARELPDAVIVSQWENSRELERIGVPVAHTVQIRTDGTYLDSEGVWEEAKRVFLSHGITQVIPVVQPFLQMTKVKSMIRRDGYAVASRKVGWIGFDSQSTQWWTRGPTRLLIYAVLQTVLGLRGHGGKQSAG